MGPSVWRGQLWEVQRVASKDDLGPMDLKDADELLYMKTAGVLRGLRELILLWAVEGGRKCRRPFGGRRANVFGHERNSLFPDCSCSKKMREAVKDFEHIDGRPYLGEDWKGAISHSYYALVH